MRTLVYFLLPDAVHLWNDGINWFASLKGLRLVDLSSAQTRRKVKRLRLKNVNMRAITATTTRQVIGESRGLWEKRIVYINHKEHFSLLPEEALPGIMI